MKPIAHSLVTESAIVIAVGLTACASSPTALQVPASVIVGEWSYASAAPTPEPPSLNTGLHVTILIESSDGSQFRGRVTFWFAGDVGVAPAVFGPVTGTLDNAGTVMMRIPFAAPDAPAITMVGTVAGDVLTVHDSVCGEGPGPFLSGRAFERSPT